ncbi:MAG TPA: M56 family metallopeptidase [Gemmatimonadales bacterium]
MTAADALAWLLTYAVHSTLLLGGVWLLTERGGVRSHRLRDLFWKTALVGGIVTATAQTALQRADWTPRFVPAREASAVISGTSSLPLPLRRETPKAAEVGSDDASSASSALSAPSVPSAPSSAPRGLPLGPALIGLWLLIAAAGLARLVASHRRFSRRLGARAGVRSYDVLALLDDLLVKTGTTTRIRLTRSDALGSPVALGVSEICVPGAVLTELDEAQQRGVLAHELAHLRRRDPLWLLAAGTIERLFFFQPLNRVARTSIQESAEYLCDDWAAKLTGSGLTVAKSLVKVAEWVRGTPAPVPLAGMAERPSQLVGRVRRLTDGSRPPERRMRWAIPAAAALLLVTALAAPGIAASGPESALDSIIGIEPDQMPFQPESEADTQEQALADPDPKVAPRSDARPDVDGSIRTAISAKIGAGISLEDAAKLDTLGLAALIAALRDPDAGVRRAAASSLGNLGSRRAVEPLIAVLRDPDPEVRENAANSLGSLEDRRAVDGLIPLLRDANVDVRTAALSALGSLDDPRAADAVVPLLRDESADVRKHAAYALGNFELTAAPPGLIAALRDQNPEVREAAVDAVSNIDDPAAVPALRELLGDTSADVRHSAVHALSNIGGAAAVQALIDAMKSSDPEVRREAADALGERD